MIWASPYKSCTLARVLKLLKDASGVTAEVRIDKTAKLRYCYHWLRDEEEFGSSLTIDKISCNILLSDLSTRNQLKEIELSLSKTWSHLWMPCNILLDWNVLVIAICCSIKKSLYSVKITIELYFWILSDTLLLLLNAQIHFFVIIDAVRAYKD